MRRSCLASLRTLSGCASCLTIWSNVWGMDEDRTQSLLALLEWEERMAAWLRIPAADRQAFVREMAQLMVRHADREMTRDERLSKDHEPPS